jgi:hypothetical protein
MNMKAILIAFLISLLATWFYMKYVQGWLSSTTTPAVNK